LQWRHVVAKQNNRLWLVAQREKSEVQSGLLIFLMKIGEGSITKKKGVTLQNTVILLVFL
ncbi:hypothetical protein, partial [Streptococcus suis]|uniref:hypothetical protein n=1 Tax=Streptococcus suis TaxID=1307 RepID=UPI0030C8DC96